MNKYLLIISLVLISLLAIGTASAGDISNITDDSSIAAASLDVNDELDVDSFKDTSTVESLSAGENKETPIVNVENISISEYGDPVIPFNVTDSSGNLISGEVVVTVHGENDTVSKHVIVSNDAIPISFEKLDLNNISEFGKGLDLLYVYNAINSSMNMTNFNTTLIMGGFSDIYHGIDINASNLILTLLDNPSINVSQIKDKLKGIISEIDMNDLNYLYALCDAVTIDKPEFMNGTNAVLNGLGLKVDDFIDVFKKISSNLNLKIPLSTTLKIYKLLNSNGNVKIQDVTNIIKEIYDHNGLTIPKLVNAVDKAINGSALDPSRIIHLILEPNSKSELIKEGLSHVINSISIDTNKVLDTLAKTEFKFNSSKITSALSDITGISGSKLSNIIDGIEDICNGTAFNKTYALNWVKDIAGGNYTDISNKILNVSQINASRIKMGFDKIIPEINFKITSPLIASELISHYAKFDYSLILGGLDKIAMGMGANVSDVMAKIYDRLGYHASFPYGFQKAGVYNISVTYLENDHFNSATNDSAKLTILPCDEFKINANVEKLPKNHGDESTFFLFLRDGYDNGIAGVLNVSLNGKKIGTVQTNKNGYGEYVIDNLTNGKYSVEFEYRGFRDSVDFSINIPLIKTSIVYSDMKTKTVNTAVDGKVGEYFKIQLKDANGNALAKKSVLIGFNGKTYERFTDENGIIKFQINIKKAGSYKISADYLGDDIYGSSHITAKITVSKQTAKLTAKKQTFKVKAKKKTVKATFKSAKGKAIKGKVIKFTIKGKTYSGKTNKKGIASVNVKLAKKGTYKVTVKFAGDSTYNKATKKITLKIK